MEANIDFKNLKFKIKKMYDQKGIEPCEVDWLFCYVLNKTRSELNLIKNITKKEYKKTVKIAKKRITGKPLEKIIKQSNFYGYNFYVNKHVLAPRMETEELVELVAKECENKNLKVLDLCTGSGAIATTLKKLTSAEIYASDYSKKALKVAKKNAKLNAVNINFTKSDMFNNIDENLKFDIIVSNPPYIKSEEIGCLQPEVKVHDPLMALDGGESGLDFYENICKNAPKYLSEYGKLFLEIGSGQAKDVMELLKKDFKEIVCKKDMQKRDRIIMAKIKEIKDDK